jgi:hypothetical protein
MVSAVEAAMAQSERWQVILGILIWAAAAGCFESQPAQEPLEGEGKNEGASASTQAVLAIQGSDGLQLLAADGSLAAELPAFTGHEESASAWFEVQASADHVLLVQHSYDPGSPSAHGGPEQYAVLLRRSDLGEIWERTGEALPYSIGPTLGEGGQVLFRVPAGDDLGRSLSILKAPSGEEHAFEELPSSAPDAQGRVAVITSSGTYGFVQAGHETIRGLKGRPLFRPRHLYETPQAVLEAGPGPEFHYLEQAADGALSFVHEQPDAVTRTALGVVPGSSLDLVRGEHAWLVVARNDANGTVLPLLAVDGNLMVHALDVPAELGPLTYAFSAGDDWFALGRSDHLDLVGWIDAATGSWKPMPALPAGMRLFDSAYCRSSGASLLDGRALVPLRDDSSGGAFLEGEDGSFTRIGSPVRDAIDLAIMRHGDTFELQAIDGRDTYCPDQAWPAPGEPGFVRGGQTQFVLGSHTHVFDTDQSSLLAHSRGRFVASLRGASELTLHDLARGSAAELHGVPIGWL